MKKTTIAIFLIILIATSLLTEYSSQRQRKNRESWNSPPIKEEQRGHHTHQRQIQSIGIEKPRTLKGIGEILETKQRHIAEDEYTAKIESKVTRQPSSWYMLIDKPGYYELTEDIINCTYECGIYINASNVVLDGKGHIIDGVYNESSKYGVYVDHATNVTIRNTKIQQWYYYGVFLNSSSNNAMYGNTVQNNYAGIHFKDSCNNEIYNNTIQNNNYGIILYYSGNNKIYLNIIENNGDWGMCVFSSSSNIIYLNDIIDPVSDDSLNKYDNGTYGNYWGVEGPDWDRDWIVDEPYIINPTSGLADNKPLLYPIEAFIYPGEDLDNDNLSNGEERLHGTNPYDNDTDDDGIIDGHEVSIYSTDPCRNDTDDDGMPDGWEVSHGLDPLSDDASGDKDGDGLSNLEEYSLGTYPDNSDSDRDGFGDGEEVSAGTDPLDPNDNPRVRSVRRLRNITIIVAVVVVMVFSFLLIYRRHRLRRIASRPYLVY